MSQVQRNQEISLILKKLAMTTHPRENVAGLSGQEWIAWIQSQKGDGSLSAQLIEFLTLGPYSAEEIVIQNQDAFQTEIHDLITAIGGAKEPQL